jgi:hypothetical protein
MDNVWGYVPEEVSQRVRLLMKMRKAMKGSPERQHLEEALKDERVGSPKIQALAHTTPCSRM